MRPIGLILIALALAMPLIYFLPLMAKHDPAAILSQYIGSTALIAMAFSQLLATRWKGMETLFGGLDRIYVLHKWLGICAMAAILFHDTIDADVRGLGRETFLNETGETLGEFSLYGFLGLSLITIITFIPYSLWRWTHMAMGALFIAATIHFALILKPFSLWDPLGLYILAFCVVGIIAYIYTLLPDTMAHMRARYTISDVSRTGGATDVILHPEGHGIAHQAGQFAFVRFDRAGFPEAHPFTLSNPPNQDRTLRVTFKPLGDDTRRLAKNLASGGKAHVSPAYGHFRLRTGKGAQIWIAGGIGITPFLAWAGNLADTSEPVHLFYCVRSRAEAAHLDELEALANTRSNFQLHLIESANAQRLTAQRIVDESGVDLKHAHIAFCGAAAMRRSLKAGLVALGLPRRRFRYEEFEIRSGIGIRRMVSGALNWISGKRRQRADVQTA